MHAHIKLIDLISPARSKSPGKREHRKAGKSKVNKLRIDCLSHPHAALTSPRPAALTLQDFVGLGKVIRGFGRREGSRSRASRFRADRSNASQLRNVQLLPNRALKAVIEARKRMRTNFRSPSRPFSRQNSQNAAGASDSAVEGAHNGALPSATSRIEAELGIGGHHVSPALRIVSPSTRAVSSAPFTEASVPIPQRGSSEPVGAGLVPLSPSRQRATSNNPPPPEEEELA